MSDPVTPLALAEEIEALERWIGDQITYRGVLGD